MVMHVTLRPEVLKEPRGLFTLAELAPNLQTSSSLGYETLQGIFAILVHLQIPAFKMVMHVTLRPEVLKEPRGLFTLAELVIVGVACALFLQTRTYKPESRAEAYAVAGFLFTFFIISLLTLIAYILGQPRGVLESVIAFGGALFLLYSGIALSIALSSVSFSNPLITMLRTKKRQKQLQQKPKRPGESNK
ncbi:unnamed protein product [Notodromas monacha]|uniref:Uncharacterized protein n=1 Tax=Notodromas monacha TaxID=399045 RepID=A0A7R9GIN3_9CRUS|nr:unnamed protein product [Notodromas monacha]CAG0922638.1 unnamed protein product [Notodromas monacha]